MKERIMITGSSGYLGNALMTALKDSDHALMPLDNGDRQRWVGEVGGASLTTYPSYRYFNLNLQNLSELANVMQYFQPTLIIHLASQPSGPYSEITYKHRIGTQFNNLCMLMNLLGVVKDLNMDTRFVVATTTGVPGAPGEPIIEGHMANLAGSSYHVSRGFDSANLQLAAKQWKLRILELRTSIVYGTRLENQSVPCTRLDWDFWFGTVVHRFCLASKAGIPIKVYGKGLQEKPFISLADCIRSFVNAISTEIKPGHEIMNQTTHCVSVNTLANLSRGEVIHIPNPRVENEEYRMTIKNEKFMKLLDKKPPTQGDIQCEMDAITADIDLKKLPSTWLNSYDGLLTPQQVQVA